MKFLKYKKIFTASLLISVVLVFGVFTTSEKEIDFSSQVKPIINKHCISCHGGVKAKAGFSLLFREDALAKAESGKPAIVPGNADASEMIRRLSHNDPEERMPYKHEPLSKEEIEILTRWIDQGAKWGDHWAYLPVNPVSVPATGDEWAINDVDHFILKGLDELKLKPSARADKATLLRRLSLDLIGMYPGDHIVESFLKNDGGKNYEQLVDSLLASPHFGERWASVWLDVARYADSKGYEADRHRQIWRYRDWVIRSFNEDKPYNKFLEEQIAGDLLPQPNDDNYIATAFHRNTMTNDEGGTDNEEFRTAAVIDRVNTTWEGIMGTTFSCVQCHSHPYDPFRHEEYYSFLAYFNNTRDEDQYPDEYPYLRTFDNDQQEQINKITAWVKENGSIKDSQAVSMLLRTWQPAVYASTADSIKFGYVSGNNTSLYLMNHSVFRLKKIDLTGVNQVIIYYLNSKPGGVISVHLDSPDTPSKGTVVLDAKGEMDMAFLTIPATNGVHDIYFSYTNKSLPVPGKNTRPNWKTDIMFDWFAFTGAIPGAGKTGYDDINKLFRKLMKSKVDFTPVMVENPAFMRRPTHVFERGNRLTRGKEVQPRVPQSLAFAMPADAPGDRRGLTMWLTDKRNPLVSRSMVNRLWEQLFGTGIVETLEDMGTQGKLPTHQALLDHYSYKFMHDYGWSLKKLLKELVMSATYQQESKSNDKLNEIDPYNKYHARGPRIRLNAEQLRDQHLCISGVISKKMYGPSVMPWQPQGIWMTPYNVENWKDSEGEDRYRRAVYTYMKRSSIYPSTFTFDGASRIVCTPRRIRTNTPLQALVALNDSAYIDMATHFATRMTRAGGEDLKTRITRGYEMMVFKKISNENLDVLMQLYNDAFDDFKKNMIATREFTGSKNANRDDADKGAMKVVANAMLNLNEVITKN